MNNASAPQLSLQAARVIARFGNASRLAAALARVGMSRHRSAIFRWTRPRSAGGTGGKIPSSALDAVMLAARLDGVHLTMEVLYGEGGDACAFKPMRDY